MLTELEHATIGPLKMVGTPVKLSDTPACLRSAPPTLGAQTSAVLQGDLGLSAANVARLRAAGIV